VSTHKVIWLEPGCPNCGEPPEKIWCQDDVFSGICDGCGEYLVAAKYALVATAEALTEDARLGQEADAI